MLIASNLHGKCRLCHGIWFLLGVQSCSGALRDRLQHFGESGMLPICRRFHSDPCLAELIPLCTVLSWEAAEAVQKGGGGVFGNIPQKLGLFSASDSSRELISAITQLQLGAFREVVCVLDRDFPNPFGIQSVLLTSRSGFAVHGEMLQSHRLGTGSGSALPSV